MMRAVRTSVVAILFSTLSLGTVLTIHASALETEVREFTVEIEGKPAGQYVMTVTKQDNGVLSMKGEANITFKYLLVTYNYSYRGVEHWKDGKLIELNSHCNDDGKKTEVNAQAQNDWLVLKVNGQQRKCRRDVWTTTYWMLAHESFHNKNVPLLDADTGKEYVGQLKYVTREQIMVAGRQVDCHHFCVTGGPTSPCDLWFDSEHKLVRQELIDQNKRVVFVLAAVRR
jgi:Family of unknown function (DUF6134)